MGQGESVTPIQIATAYSAIANGGMLRTPHIVQAIGDKRDTGPAASGSSPRRPPPSCATCSRACSPTAAPRRAPRSPATTSRARPVRRTRSSTASTPTPPTRRRSSASSPPTAPAAVAVMVDRPQGPIYGGSVAAPGLPEDRRLGRSLPRDRAQSDPRARHNVSHRGLRRLTHAGRARRRAGAQAQPVGRPTARPPRPSTTRHPRAAPA